MEKTILEISDDLRHGKVSPIDLTQHCLAKIEKLNPVLNAFITVTGEAALAEARAAEEEIRRGNWRGPLHGVPIALKDIIDTARVRTTAASGLFKDRVPGNDAEVVRRLRSGGAVLLGKQNLHEFAYGGSSLISYFGEVRNPWNTAHIAGGSSGGSASAVAAGLCYGAIGTDTAGSVREPASQCGVVGLKPTYGRVSVKGVIPLSRSFDHVGQITKTTADAAVMVQVIAGYDEQDPNSANVQVDDYVAGFREDPKPLRIGIARKFFFEDLDSEVAPAIEEAINVLKKLAGEVRDVDLTIPTDRRLQSAESYAFHAEFVKQSPELYQPETLRRIRSGEGITGSEIGELHKELARTRGEANRIFDDVDLVVTPTTPIPAPGIDELKEHPELLRPKELILLRNTRPFNVWGLPAISVPCGFTKAGLPIGLQIAGAHWAESKVLRMAHAYEQATQWSMRRPELASA